MDFISINDLIGPVNRQLTYLTVGQLIEELKKYPPGVEVKLNVYNEGEHNNYFANLHMVYENKDGVYLFGEG